MTTFPTSLDTFPSAASLAGENLSTTPHSTLHGNIGDALEAIEATIGITGSTDSDDLTGQIAIIGAGVPTFFTPVLSTGGSGGYTEIGYGTPTALSGSPTLSAAISTTNGTSVSVSSGSAISDGDVIQIDSELLRVTAGGGTGSLTVTRGVAGSTAATHTNGTGIKSPMIKRGKWYAYGNVVKVRYMIRLGGSPTLGTAGDIWSLDLPPLLGAVNNLGNTADIIGRVTIGHSYLSHEVGNVHLGRPYDVDNYGVCYFVCEGGPVLTNNANTHSWGTDPGYGDAVASTDTITCPSAHGLSSGDIVRLSAASATFPGGLAIGDYYVIASGLTSTAFKVSATSGGSAVNISSDGALYIAKPPQPISVWNDFHVQVEYEIA